jgi:hypothetical protein
MAQTMEDADIMVAETAEDTKTLDGMADGMAQLQLNPASDMKIPQIPEDYIHIYDFMRYEGFVKRVDSANESKFIDQPTMYRLWRELCHEKIQAYGPKADWSAKRMQDEFDEFSGWVRDHFFPFHGLPTKILQTVGYNGFRPSAPENTGSLKQRRRCNKVLS